MEYNNYCFWEILTDKIFVDGQFPQILEQFDKHLPKGNT